jgi:UDP-glucuronate decarboxylase
MVATSEYDSVVRILVTGGAGFLGSHLIDRLLNDGHDVICLDNFYTGSRVNIETHLHNSRFELIRHDVTFPMYYEIEGIFNLACPASPIHYQNDPVQTLKTSVHGAINLLGLAKRTGSRIFQASTSEIYGDPTISPQSEEYWGNVNPIGVRSCYDEGKRAAETLFFDYNRQHAVDIRVARIFNTYGPRMSLNDGRVVSNFILQALRNEPITVYGDGNQTRSFCYVDDLVEGFIKLFFKEDIFQPINLGNPEPISMIQLAEEILDLTGSKSRIEKMALPADDPTNREPDISKAKSILGWEPKVKRIDGLRKTIEYFEKELASSHGI